MPVVPLVVAFCFHAMERRLFRIRTMHSFVPWTEHLRERIHSRTKIPALEMHGRRSRSLVRCFDKTPAIVRWNCHRLDLKREPVGDSARRLDRGVPGMAPLVLVGDQPAR